MRPLYETGAALLTSALLLPATVDAITMNCKELRASGVSFNFEKLGGPKTLSLYESEPPGHRNTTFTIDICKPLKVPSDKKERAKTCPAGTQVCGIEKKITDDDEVFIEKVLPIVRSNVHDGAKLEPKNTLLSKSDSNEDSEKEGLRIEIKGGIYDKKPAKISQRAVIEFLCKRGNEAEERRVRRASDDEDNEEGDDDKDNEGDDKDDDDDDEEEWKKYQKTDDGEGGTLELFKWDPTPDENILRLNWHTKFACEDYEGNGSSGEDGKPSGGWGFFSWFFLLLFLGVVGYFGFFAWVNYSKYGAHGWDLLPHSDTIRDVPYILGDWGRKVVGTFTGGPSRGGYSAV